MTTKVNSRENVMSLASKAGFGMMDVRQNITKYERLTRLVEQHLRDEFEKLGLNISEMEDGSYHVQKQETTGDR